MSDPRAGMPPLDAEAAQYLKPGEQMLCYACRPAGRCQMGITAVRPDGDRALVAEVVCPANFEGGPRVAHGGWTAAVFDEVLGHLGPSFGGLTVTGRLSVDFLKPVPVGLPLRVHVRVDRVEGRKWFLEGEMVLVGVEAVLGRAQGVFIERKPGHFESHRRWVEGQG